MKKILSFILVLWSLSSFGQSGPWTEYQIYTKIDGLSTYQVGYMRSVLDSINKSKVSLLGSYANPSWITSLAFGKLTGVPTAFTFTASDFDVSGGNVVSLDFTNMQKSTTSTIGVLTDTDWDLFNDKQAALVSGVNIRTLENLTLLGSTNIDLAKGDVGLGNVDNTSDANKPVSTATQTALDLKQNTITFTASDFDYSAPTLSVDYTNGQAASGSLKGFLTSADWTTFNDKQATGLSWLIASGPGVLTGVNSITSNTLDQVLFNGTATATANNQRLVDMGGTLTPRSTVSDAMWTLGLSSSFVYTAASQNLQALRINGNWNNSGAHATTFGVMIDIQPTFTGTISQMYALRTSATASVNVAIGAATASSGARLTVGGSGTTTGVALAVTNSAQAIRFSVLDNGVMNHVVSGAGNAVTFAHTWTATSNDNSDFNTSGTITGTGTGNHIFAWYRAGHSMTTGAVNQIATWLYVSTSSSFTANHTGGLYRGIYFNPTVNGTQTATAGVEFSRHDLGYVRWASVLTPSQITSNQNDYNPTGWTAGGAPYGASITRLNTDASRDITGWAGGVDGRIVYRTNTGSFNIVLKHGVSSSSANQYSLPNGVDLTVPPGGSWAEFYDNTSTKWRVLSLGTPTSLSLAAAAKTGTYSVASGDYLLLGDATSGAFDMDLPTAASCSGCVFVIKKTDATANAVSIDPNGTELIDGSSTSVTISTQWASKTIQSNGTSWFIIGN